jgi:hypothetical protein
MTLRSKRPDLIPEGGTMRVNRFRFAVAVLSLAIFGVTGSTVSAQGKKRSGPEEVYTGTVVNMSGRMVSTGFNLTITGLTSDDEVQQYLGVLAEGDQFDLLKLIKDKDLGFMSATRSLGRRLIIARKTQTDDGKIRIVAVFERWKTMAEVRDGYRIQDYPFGLLELILNDQGKGGGTFIAACKIDLKKDKKTGKYQLELENFGTLPMKVMGVMRRSK